MAITTTYKVAGMNCGHCIASVTSEVSAIDGVEKVDVALGSNSDSAVTVTSSAPLDLTAVREAIDEAGYKLTGTA